MRWVALHLQNNRGKNSDMRPEIFKNGDHVSRENDHFVKISAFFCDEFTYFTEIVVTCSISVTHRTALASTIIMMTASLSLRMMAELFP